MDIRRKVSKIAALFLGAVAMTLPVWAASDNTLVTMESGKLKGAVENGVVAFKGVPFAAPPVGDLRWRMPQPVKPWAGVRPATDYSPDCLQLPFPSDAAPVGAGGLSEDCLYANVWAPAKHGNTKLPVMVWIYGGGFVNGGSSPQVYDGTHFAEHGVIFVSFNYRVGRFGFFGFPALTAEHPEEPHGNYGYMDQIAALKWVQRNIAAFGGDPGTVTVLGESAGGGSVLTLLTSPLSQGLFQRAIVESGGGRDLLLGPRFLSKTSPQGNPSAEAIGLKFAESVGVSGSGPEALADLRKLPADKVVAGLNMATMGQAAATYPGPIVDGMIVKESPQSALLAGRWAKVPVMIGANSADIGFPRGRTLDEVFAPFGSDADKAKAAFNPDHSENAMVVGIRIAADQMMVEPSRFVAQTVAAQGLPAFEYRFSYVAESIRDKVPGAPHATEIPYVFDTVKAAYKDKLTPQDEALAQKANAYWVNFGKTGNPSGEGLPAWPSYDAKTDTLMNFTIAQGPVAMPDPWRARLDLIAALADKPPAPMHAAIVSAGSGVLTTGAWAISGDIQGYPLKEDCALTVQQSAVTGSCTTPEKTYAVTGTIDGGKVIFKHGGEYNGDALTLTYTGAMSPEGLLSGTVDVDPMNVSGTFSAKKAESN
ncbi:MAG: carboxylesterase family protein [Terracidiphilus sp.]